MKRQRGVWKAFGNTLPEITRLYVVIVDPYALQVGVNDRRADELEAPFLQVL